MDNTGEAGGPQIAVRVRGLVNRFGDNLVHDGLDLDVHRGEIIGVVGASGTGKSVLLRSICGLIKPKAGVVELLGETIDGQGQSARRQLEKRTGVMFQNGALFSSLTVSQNIRLPIREYYRLGTRLACDIMVMKLRLVGLAPDVAYRSPAELSGGMRKRVALARALALDPEILFLDEPTAGLDPVSAAQFDELIYELARALGLTVFMVTHDLDSLHTVCDRIAVLAEHRVLAIGTLAYVKSFDHPWVDAYFHGPRGRAVVQSRQPAS